MGIKNRAGYVWKTVAVLAAAGMLFGSSCSLRELEAITVGLDAAAGHLEAEDDITFGEWLLSELNK